VCVYKCVCGHVSAYVCVGLYVCARLFVFVCVCGRVSVYKCVCVYMCVWRYNSSFSLSCFGETPCLAAASFCSSVSLLTGVKDNETEFMQ
jgi:hypothetical protein